jgi:precorrin-6Y C5,15-methyltransferase (decarboxylating)
MSAPPAPLTVIGLGADGWAGLGDAARAALRQAPLVVGSPRQLDLIHATEVLAARRPWPSPMAPLLDELARAAPATTACVLASGDPMLHGVGATLVRRLGPARVRILPHPSALALACARLGWPAAGVELVSAVGRPSAVIARALQPGRRVVAYVTGEDGAARLARVVREQGFGVSRLVVLEQLGGPHEQLTESTAAEWGADRRADPLHVVALEVRADPGTRALARTPGLRDDAFASDGQLTKRHVRAITIAALAPLPGELLWDVGAGNGSIAVEWLRAEPTARALAIEPRADRAERIAQNARRLGVPHLQIRRGHAPAALEEDEDRPDVVFIGGGVTTPGLLPTCWAALRPGGRLVANTVTLEGEQAVLAAQRQHGGTLTRIDIAHAEPVGGFSGWRAQMTVVQWATTKHEEHPQP